jgi:hypothetical protein
LVQLSRWSVPVLLGDELALQHARIVTHGKKNELIENRT